MLNKQQYKWGLSRLNFFSFVFAGQSWGWIHAVGLWRGRKKSRRTRTRRPRCFRETSVRRRAFCFYGTIFRFSHATFFIFRRPDSSFMWFLNPIKSIRYIIWHNYKWTILKILLWVMLVVFLVLFFYALPGYTIKRMLGAWRNYIEDKNAFYFEKRRKRQIPSLYLNCYHVIITALHYNFVES